MLDTIAEFAWQRLESTARGRRARDRHAAYFRSLAETAAPELMGSGQMPWLERLETERDNLRAALSHLLEQGDAASAVRLARGLLFWWLHAYVEEGVGWTERIVAASGSLPAPVRGMALAEAGVMAFGNADPDRASSLLEESLSLLRDSGTEGPMVVPITILGELATRRGDHERATELLEDGLERSRASGASWYTAMQLNFLGQIPEQRRDYDEAAERFADALTLSRQVGDRFLILQSLSNLARVSHEQGDEARERPLLREGLSLAAEVGDDVSIAHYLQSLAALAEQDGEIERAGRLHGAAEQLRSSWAGSGWLEAVGAPASALRARLRGAATEAFERAVAQGAEMGRRRAVEYALDERN
jgi:tetratricopeptide (TPR) repeat protein